MGIIPYLLKNIALIIGIIEAIIKVLGGVVSLTPTKKDDEFLAKVDEFFSAIKRFFYDISDKLAGK
jgi:hypothetical protein